MNTNGFGDYEKKGECSGFVESGMSSYMRSSKGCECFVVGIGKIGLAILFNRSFDQKCTTQKRDIKYKRHSFTEPEDDRGQYIYIYLYNTHIYMSPISEDHSECFIFLMDTNVIIIGVVERGSRAKCSGNRVRGFCNTFLDFAC